MVKHIHGIRSERGATRIGCLFLVLLAVLIVYYALPVGQAYFGYLSLRDELRTQAQFAATIDDATIQRRILQQMSELEVPNEARTNLTVVRTTRAPFQIIISTSYPVEFEFPFTRYVHTFSIEARRPL